MNSTVLSNLIKANLLKIDPKLSESPTLSAFCEAIADAVVSHITSSAVVHCGDRKGNIT